MTRGGDPSSLVARLGSVMGDSPRGSRQVVTWVEDVTRTAILSGIVKPGERLRQETVAGVFGVSRLPVREALKALESEGLVVSAPRRGFVVTELDAEDVDELYDLRALLEGEAVRLAIPRLTKEDVADLEGLHEDMVTAATEAAKIAARDRYHMRLYAASGRPRLVELIASLRKETARASRWPGLQDSHTVHDHIFKAVRESDVQEAVDHITTHYALVAQLIRRHLRTTGSPSRASLTSYVDGARGAAGTASATRERRAHP